LANITTSRYGCFTSAEGSKIRKGDVVELRFGETGRAVVSAMFPP
jgi:hypothetical protein